VFLQARKREIPGNFSGIAERSGEDLLKWDAPRPGAD
jgi:hypothetical protein